MQFDSSDKCAETSELNFFPAWAYMYTTLKHFGKRVIQTNPSKFDERDRQTETKTDREDMRERIDQRGVETGITRSFDEEDCFRRWLE